MTQTSQYVRRVGRFRALWLIVLAMSFTACDAADRLTSTSEDTPTATTDPNSTPAEPSFATSFAGGIAMGTWAQPTYTLGSRYNGTLRVIWPKYVKSELAAIRSRGGKVILSMTGSESTFKDRYGHFSFDKWKARVLRYKGMDLSSFVRDGTLIGHFLMDEPNDPSNWNGRLVTPAQVEAMAKFSKMLWPYLPTVVRAEPKYLSYNHHYLDAAWAQYVTRKGTASDYLRNNVSNASKRGLALVVGLNIRRGGPGGRAMTGSEIAKWGSTMLSSTYPCAFLSWQYSSQLNLSSVKSAMDLLRRKAQARPTKSCR
jgi:hypothetical protein